MSESKKEENHPNFRKHLSEKTRKKISEANKGRKRSEESKRKQSLLMKGENHPNFKKHLSEETKNRIGKANTGKKPSKESKKKMSLSKQGIKNNRFGTKHTEESKKKISKSHIGLTHSEESKKKMSEAKKGKKLTEETKKKLSEARKGKNSYNWKGGISFEPYCPKFNEAFKESIRDKFDRTCFLCNITESEQIKLQKERNKRPFRLSVHHVNYDKNCLCDNIKCEFVPLCIPCHAKTSNGDRLKWENEILEKIKTYQFSKGVIDDV